MQVFLWMDYETGHRYNGICAIANSLEEARKLLLENPEELAKAKTIDINVEPTNVWPAKDSAKPNIMALESRGVLIRFNKADNESRQV